MRTDAWRRCCFLTARAVQCLAWLGRENREREGLMENFLLSKVFSSPLIGPSSPFPLLLLLLPLPTKVSHLKLPPPRPFQLVRLLSGSKWVEDGSVLFPASHLTSNNLTRIQPTLVLNPTLAGHLERIEDMLDLLLLIITAKLAG